jgi:hypothetical protein
VRRKFLQALPFTQRKRAYDKGDDPDNPKPPDWPGDIGDGGVSGCDPALTYPVYHPCSPGYRPPENVPGIVVPPGGSVAEVEVVGDGDGYIIYDPSTGQVIGGGPGFGEGKVVARDEDEYFEGNAGGSFLATLGSWIDAWVTPDGGVVGQMWAQIDYMECVYTAAQLAAATFGDIDKIDWRLQPGSYQWAYNSNNEMFLAWSPYESSSSMYNPVYGKSEALGTSLGEQKKHYQSPDSQMSSVIIGKISFRVHTSAVYANRLKRAACFVPDGVASIATSSDGEATPLITHIVQPSESNGYKGVVYFSHSSTTENPTKILVMMTFKLRPECEEDSK